MQQLPAQEKRVETGAVQFGDDWPGVFIRGDNAGHYAMVLKDMLASTTLGPIDKMTLSSLQRLLADAVVGPAREMVQPDAADTMPRDGSLQPQGPAIEHVRSDRDA